jgi:tRNA modification GTPase
MSNRLIDFASLLELELDFSEEDVEFVDRSDFINQLKSAKKELEKIIATYQIGRMAREGVKLVIVGKPNVGKSSLLNALVKEERAIVTDVPGTTRDPLEVQLDIKGVWFRIFDTAGIKESDDRIEQEGIKRARRHLESADIIVHVFDGTLALEKEDHDIIDAIRRLDRSRVVRVINKSDLSQNIERENLNEESVALLSLSAVTGEGIESLEDEIYRGVLNDDTKVFSDEIMVTNVRHWEALKNGVESLSKAIEQAEQGMSSEFISLYLRDALNFLGQITGKVTSEDILNNIFSRFCIGK